MPVVDINPNNSGSIMLGIADPPTQEYACQITNFKIDPVEKSQPVPETFCRPEGERATASSHAATFEYLQDWGAPNSISQFMKDNDGKLVYFIYEAGNPALTGATGAFWARAGSFGGTPGESWSSSGNLPLEGDYTVTPPVAADTAAARKSKSE
jgi:hypothetical protein